MRTGVLHRRCASLRVSPQRWNWLAVTRDTRLSSCAREVRHEVRVSEELPDAVNGWRTEASVLHKQRNWEYWRAYDHVVVRYLAAGHARPLLDLILNLKRQPRRRTSEFIAAITDGKALLDQISGLSDLPLVQMRGRFRHCVPTFEIRISERRGRGRPKPGPEDAAKAEIRLILVCGFGALAAGIPASDAFWSALAAALDPKRHERSIGRPFPFKAELVRTDGGIGRPRDPELRARDQVFHASVREKMAAGTKYEFAIKDALADLEAQRKAEGWTKEFKPKIIRDAYDRTARKGRRN